MFDFVSARPRFVSRAVLHMQQKPCAAGAPVPELGDVERFLPPHASQMRGALQSGRLWLPV